MNSSTQLFIRACKSKDPVTRLYSVHRRVYCQVGEDDSCISYVLGEICDKYKLCSLIDFANRMNETPLSYNEEPASEWKKTMIVFMRIIRMAEVKKLEGLRAPAKFRR